MPHKNKEHNIQFVLESDEAKAFTAESVDDILENLATLLISSWEKDHVPEKIKDHDSTSTS